MPRYTWKLGGDEARKQWANLPEDTRRLVNRRIEELLENPTGDLDREYDARRALHLIPIGEGKGYIQYAVVEDARLVIVYRFPPRRLD
jgi:mRNA-degrading endonuclease RelE of RelBE toxin-antitoxin system